MSSMYNPTYLGKNALQNQLLNTICGNHDLICKCDEPLKHTALLIFEKARPTNFTEEQKKTIKKCLGEDAGDGAVDTTDHIDPGDLEKLFAEDTVTATDG